MNSTVRTVLTLPALALLAACADTATAPTPDLQSPRLEATADAGGAAGRYIVEFQKGVPSGFGAQVAALGGAVEWSHQGMGMATVTGISDAAVAQLAALAGVAGVTADGVMSLDSDETVEVAEMDADAVAAADAAASPAAPQTASFFPRQWHLRAVGAHTAWAAGVLGSSDVRVAIIDTGISYTHADLAGRVDLSRSISLVPGDNAILAPTTFNLVSDLHYHGTHVAATVSSNAVAAAGVTSRVTLMGVKVLDRFGNGFTSRTIAGVLFAVDNGADVINMSLGGGFAKAHNAPLHRLIGRAFAEANRRGVVVVVSAGNDAEDMDHNGNRFVSYCDAGHAVCVSATGPTASPANNGPWTNVDNPATYSNFGRSAVSVAGPGGMGTFRNVWAACSRTSLAQPVCQTGTFVLGLSGTSQATPHVSALAALLVERIGKGRPAQVRARIMQSADDLGEPGTDPFYGKGRINIPNAIL